MGSYENIAVRDSSGRIVAYQNVSTGQISYGIGNINYDDNSSKVGYIKYNALVSQSASQHDGTSSEIQSKPSSALEIAQLVSRRGGPVSESLAEKAGSEGYSGELLVTSGRSVVQYDKNPTARQGLLAELPSGPTATIYAPVGKYSQVALENARAVVSESGQIGIYTPRYIGGQLSRYMGLQSSGGRGAVQSGGYSLNEPLTTRIYSPSGLKDFTPLGKSARDQYSALGSEAYGGQALVPLDTRTIESTGASVSTYANKANLANLVDPYAVNKSKSELPDVNIPLQLSQESPTIQLVDRYGSTSKYTNVAQQANIRQQAGIPLNNKSNLYFTSLSKFEGSGIEALAGTKSYVKGNVPELSGNLAYNVLAEAAEVLSLGFVKSSDLVKSGTTVEESTLVLPTPFVYNAPKAVSQESVAKSSVPMPFVANAPSGYKPGSVEYTIKSTSYDPGYTPGKIVISQTTESQNPTIIEEKVWNPLASITQKELPAVTASQNKVAGMLSGSGIPVISRIGAAESMLLGGYSEFRESPGTVIKSYAGGFAFAGAVEIAGKAITTRVAGTALEPYVTKAGNYGSKLLAGVYATDVGLRATDYGTTFDTYEVSTRLGGILATETGPMIAGGYSASMIINRVYPTTLFETGTKETGMNIFRQPENQNLGLITPEGEFVIPTSTPDFIITSSKGTKSPFKDISIYQKSEFTVPSPEVVRIDTGAVLNERFGGAVSLGYEKIVPETPGENINIPVIDLRMGLSESNKGLTLEFPAAKITTSIPKYSIAERIKYVGESAAISVERSFPATTFVSDWIVTRGIPKLSLRMAGVESATVKQTRPLDYDFSQKIQSEIKSRFGTQSAATRRYGGSVTETYVTSKKFEIMNRVMFQELRKGYSPVIQRRDSGYISGINQRSASTEIIRSAGTSQNPMEKPRQFLKQSVGSMVAGKIENALFTESGRSINQKISNFPGRSNTTVIIPKTTPDIIDETATTSVTRIRTPKTTPDITNIVENIVNQNLMTASVFYQSSPEQIYNQPDVIQSPVPTARPPSTPFSGFGFAPGGGDSYRPQSPAWLDKWARTNPVADIPYLSRGLSGPSFGSPISGKKSGRRKGKYIRYRDRISK